MSLATSILLIAVGAILRYAINLDSNAVSIPTIGLILMICGGAGLALTLLFELMRSNPKRNDEYPPRRDDFGGPDDRTRRLR